MALEDASPALAAAAAETRGPVLFEVLIIGDRLNVRAEPGLGGVVVAKLLQGDQAPVIGSTADAGWYEVLLADGSAAWIAAEYAAEVESEPETPTSVDADEADADEADADETDADEADADEADADETDADETDADEEPAAANEGVNDDPVSEDDPAEAASSAGQEAAAAETGQPTAITQPDAMNVRGGPSTTFPVVTNVPAGTCWRFWPVAAPATGIRWRYPTRTKRAGSTPRW